MNMDYARQRAIQALKNTHFVILASSGPAGVQAGEVKCEDVELSLYLLVPQTSDHLFNLEGNPTVTLLTSTLEIKGEAHILPAIPAGLDLRLIRETEAGWCALVRVDPHQIHVRNPDGWGYRETIDLSIYSRE